MLEQSPSRTALAAAYLRAAHMRLDDQPPVLEDRISGRLLPYYLQRLIAVRAAFSPTWLRRLGPRDPASALLRGHIVLRARYAEDALAEARRAGVNRYVILGAGLDTFALRQPDPPMNVVEIDHPATQSWKKQLLHRNRIEPPPTLTFLPIDFERSSLRDRWIPNSAPDFISWLGTTYYLSHEGITNTLEALAECTCAGSELVLDYWRESPTGLVSPLLLGTRLAVAAQGEPMHSFFEPVEIEALAVAAGWRVKESCSPSEQTRRYLENRKDSLSVPSFAYLLRLQN